MPEPLTAQAHEMIVAVLGVRVVPDRPAGDVHLLELTERDGSLSVLDGSQAQLAKGRRRVHLGDYFEDLE
jgi:hypothetical protein